MSDSGLKSSRTTVKRIPKRGSYDREAVHAVLDGAFLCHVGFAIEGRPYVIPTGYGRAGDYLYIHGSAASRMLRNLSSGIDVCLTVTILDGLVMARSAFHHSMNYRSVVVLGKAELLSLREEKEAALLAISEQIAPGRWREVRPPTESELKATTVLRLKISEASAKTRSGPPVDDDEDYDLAVWAGVIPYKLTALDPLPDPALDSGIPVSRRRVRYRERVNNSNAARRRIISAMIRTIDLMPVRSAFVTAFLLVLTASITSAQSEAADIPAGWQTKAEATAYKETWRYDETVAFAKKLDAASPLLKYESYGKSGEGRDMPLLIAATGSAFTPALARQQGKAVVLVQAGIHAGEIDGKDAGLALLRDIAITKTRLDLLKNVVILFEVIYNVDGHENFNPYMRINQNGPAEMGFRGNASNLNLNRDYMKADAPETRAWLGLWNKWNPDIFIDCHVTDGAEFQYNVTYEYAHFQEVHPAIKLWMDEHFDGAVVPKIEKEGNLLTHYVEFAGREVTGGVATFIATPKYATGYTPLRNRAGLLIETHVYKPYRSRVRGTYDTLRYFIEEIGSARQSLFVANVTADAQTVERGKVYDDQRQFPLKLGVSDKAVQVQFKGTEYKMEDSTISNTKRIVYGTAPLNVTIPKFDEGRVLASAPQPIAYVIPPQYADVIEVLKLHGIRFERLKKSTDLEVESYQLSEPKWASAPFENRVTVTAKQTTVRETRNFAAGSVVVPLDQEAAAVVVHLLEPNGPDSFVYWGFFNSIFEQKEYGEGYILEKLAREMLAKDPKLQEEFDRRLLDPAFARSPQARLRFFYERSPYYLNQKVGVYPVGRIVKPYDGAALFAPPKGTAKPAEGRSSGA